MSSLIDSLRRKSGEILRRDHTSDQPQSQSHPTSTSGSSKPESNEQYLPPPGPPPAGRDDGLSPAHAVNQHHVGAVHHQASGDPGRGAHQARQSGSNLGMAAGALIGAESGGNPVMGMVEGQVAGTMVAQQINQHQRHQYWREQASNYRAGLPADGVGGDPGLQPPVMAEGGRDRSRSRSRSAKRDEKRKERWDRREARRDG